MVKNSSVRIGVLTLQGAFFEHMEMIKSLNAEAVPIRRQEELREIDGLIIPGGESTTMGKLLQDFDIKDELFDQIEKGLPVWGTCAGMIILAKKINGSEVRHIPVMDIDVVRNGYGRQLGSFVTEASMVGVTGEVPMVFIRAPYISAVGENVQILATVYGKIVAAKEGNLLATSFHPELTRDTRIHSLFMDMIKNR